MTTFIYVLRDPRTAEVRYLGRTVNPKRRTVEHAKARANNQRCAWVRELAEFGLRPVMQVIDSCSVGAREIEAEWIGLLVSHEVRLLNVSLDGFGGSPFSVTQGFRAKMSAITRGRLVSEATRRKMAQANRGKKRGWSLEGGVRVKATQFKLGVNTFASMTPDQQVTHRARSASQWAAIEPEARSRMASERNRAAWEKRTPEMRKAIGANIRAGQKKNESAFLLAIREGVARREANKVTKRLEQEQRAAVATEACTWIGTGYHPHARIKGVGVDCAQLLCAVFEACGLVPPIDTGHYPIDWHMHHNVEMFIEWLAKYAVQVPAPARLGDVCLFRFGRTFSHGSIYVGDGLLVHAYVGRGVILSRADQEPLDGRPMQVWSVWQ